MKTLKQRITSINPVTSFRNLCIAGTVTAATSLPAFAIDTAAVETALQDGGSKMEVIGTAVVGALVILAVAGLIYSMLRKA